MLEDGAEKAEATTQATYCDLQFCRLLRLILQNEEPHEG
jgi:hypothetical protein